MFSRLLIFILFGLLSGSVLARPLVVAIIDIPPFGFLKDSGKGVHVEFMSAVMAETKIPYVIKVMPYPRVIKALQEGKVDLTLVYKRNDLTNVHEVAKSVGFKNYILSRRSHVLTSEKDLKGKKITIVRSAKYQDSFDENKEIKKISVNNYLQALAMVAGGRVDGGVISEPALRYYKNLRPDLFENLTKGLTLNTKYNYIYAHKSLSRGDIEKITSANTKMIQRPSHIWFKGTGKKDH